MSYKWRGFLSYVGGGGMFLKGNIVPGFAESETGLRIAPQARFWLLELYSVVVFIIE